MTDHVPPALLFDIDGTLLEPRDPLHTRAFAEALSDLLGSEHRLDLRGTSGMLDRAILAAIYPRTRQPPISPRMLNRACTLMARSYLRGPFDDTTDRTLPGVRALLAALHQRGVPMGVVTGNIGTIARKRLDRAGLRDYFIAGAFGSEAMRRETLIRRAMRRLSKRIGIALKPENVIVIGDTPHDILAARSAGVRCLAVASGDVSEQELGDHQPALILPNLRDTSRVLETLNV